MHPVNLEKYPADLNNPQEGDIVYGRMIGKRNNGAYMWSRCPDCNRLRWVLKYNNCLGKRCRSCAGIKERGRNSPAWNGGRTKNRYGYIMLRIYPDDPYFLMGRRSGNKGLTRVVLEHRLVMARYLGRCLKSWEIVHHKNSIKVDNRLANLELVTPGSHCIYSQLEKDNKALRNKVTEMDIEIQVLHLELEAIKMELSKVSLED